MCIFDIDKAGFPLVARREDEIFYHFFPLTRIQFEIAIASGWLIEDRHLGANPEFVTNILTRGEVFFPGCLDIAKDTPEHALPIEVMLFPGGYMTVNQLIRKGLAEINDANIYSLYATNLKQEEYASLIEWLGGERFLGGMPTHKDFSKTYYQFMHFHVRELIRKILELEGLNPRARNMLELFNRYKGVINGLPRDIFEMTANYIESHTEQVLEYSRKKPLPGVDKAGYPLYYPVIAGEAKLWPHIPVKGKMRHLKVECHPLVGSRGVYRRRR